MRRIKCKMPLKSTAAKNGANLCNGKHRRAEAKRKAKSARKP